MHHRSPQSENGSAGVGEFAAKKCHLNYLLSFHRDWSTYSLLISFQPLKAAILLADSSWWDHCSTPLLPPHQLRDLFIFIQSETLSLLMGMKQTALMMSRENRMSAGDGWREHVSTKERQCEDGGCTEICGGGGVIRWMSTNSTILHVVSRSRRHEMSVDSSPFMRFVPFLCRTFLPAQRQMEGVIQSDQTPETLRSEGKKGHMKQGGSVETTDHNKMCR